ncbi:MAG: extracellular solute-binding protein [Clostridia bacterium]|nr:extracellular solute-binding protein [Clostridia bacterium]
MKRYFSLLLLLAFLMVSLSGCHGVNEKKPFVAPETFDESKTYEISFWAKNDTNKTQTEIYEKAISDFEKLYPNVKVNLKLYNDYGRIYNDVITNINTDSTPNVCITYPDHIATYMASDNCVVKLDELFTNKKYGLGGSEVRFDAPKLDEIVPKFLSECVIDGNYYALPFMRSTEACYVNKTLVEKLGYTLPETLTWDFVWEVSEAAAKKDENGIYIANGQKAMIPFIYKSTDNMMIQMLRQLNAPYSSENGEILIFNDTTQSLLLEIAEHVKTDAFSTFTRSSYPANHLNAGRCVFAVDSTAGATWMGSHAPLSDIPPEDFVEFETVVYPIPQADPENPVMISQGPSVCVFNKDDPNEVLASWLFTQFLLTNEVQLNYSSTEGYVPVTLKAQNTEQYKDYLSRGGEDDDFYYDIKIKAAKILLDNLENTFVTPVFNGSASLRNTAGQLIESVVKNIKRKKVVSEETIPGIYSDLIAMYRLNMDKGGSLPKTSVMLLAGIGAVWVMIGLYAGINFLQSKRKAK